MTLVLNAWLPKGYELPGGLRTVAVLHDGNDWEIFAVQDGARALVVRNLLAQRWIEADLIEEGVLTHFSFGSDAYLSLVSRPEHMLAPVADCRSPNTKAEALAFAQALKATRAADPDNALQDAIYAEAISRLLPTYSVRDGGQGRSCPRHVADRWHPNFRQGVSPAEPVRELARPQPPQGRRRDRRLHTRGGHP